MSIESDLFLRYSCDFEKLIEFGFKKEKQKYVLEKTFMKGEFRALISVSKTKHQIIAKNNLLYTIIIQFIFLLKESILILWI